MSLSKQYLINLLEAEKDKLFKYAEYRLYDIQDVEDVLQNIFFKVLSEPDKFDSVKNPRSYLYRMLANECTSVLRISNKNVTISLNNLPSFDITILQPENFEEEFIIINRLLSTIPDDQSETIRLRLHSDLTFNEIADIMNVPVATAKARFRYGILKIREGLKKENLL